MPNPVPGKQYTVVSGDTLSEIAAKAYGDPGLWPRIFNANQKRIKSGDQDLIAAGEVLIIPFIPEEEKLRAAQAAAGRIQDGPELKIEERIVPVRSLRVFRTMDSMASGWTANIAWKYGADKRLDELTAPYAYPKASVSLDGELQVTGRLYRVNVKKTNEGTELDLYGFSYTKDVVDSTLSPPYEVNNITLLRRCNDLLRPMGIGVEIITGLDPGGQFARVTATPTEKKFAHLARLARQRKLILSDTRTGSALLTKADLFQRAVGTIEEDVSLVSEWTADFDGTKLYNVYRVLSQGAAKTDQKVGIAKDDNVPVSRFATFTVNDSLKGEMNEIAAWRRNRAAAEALGISLPVNGWRAPNKKLWEENTRVTVKSRTLRIPDGFTLLNRRVEFLWSDEGKNSVLNLIPPGFYDNGSLDTPW